MPLKDPFAYILAQCVANDVSLEWLCKKAKVSRRNIIRWRDNIPKSIQSLYRIDQVLKKLEAIDGVWDSHELESELDAIMNDPKRKARLIAGLEKIIEELKK